MPPMPQIIILESQLKEYYPFPAGHSELHFLAQRGELDLFFLSGIQIDRQGNINLHVIGDYDAPKMRLPGAYGSAMLYYMAHRVILFRTEHTRRTFVEKVDFITAPGITPANVHREGGPNLGGDSQGYSGLGSASRGVGAGSGSSWFFIGGSEREYGICRKDLTFHQNDPSSH